MSELGLRPGLPLTGIAAVKRQDTGRGFPLYIVLLGFLVLLAVWLWALRGPLTRTAQVVLKSKIQALVGQAGMTLSYQRMRVDFGGVLEIQDMKLRKDGRVMASADTLRLSGNTGAIWDMVRGRQATPVSEVLWQGGSVRLVRRSDGSFDLPQVVSRPQAGGKRQKLVLPHFLATGVGLVLEEEISGNTTRLDLDYGDISWGTEGVGTASLTLTSPWFDEAVVEGELDLKNQEYTIKAFGKNVSVKPIAHKLGFRVRNSRTLAWQGLVDEVNLLYQGSLKPGGPKPLLQLDGKGFLGVLNGTDFKNQCATRWFRYDGKFIRTGGGLCVGRVQEDFVTAQPLLVGVLEPENPFLCYHQGGSYGPVGPEAILKVGEVQCRQAKGSQADLFRLSYHKGILEGSGQVRIKGEELASRYGDEKTRELLGLGLGAVKHRETIKINGSFGKNSGSFAGFIKRDTKGAQALEMAAFGKFSSGILSVTRAKLHHQQQDSEIKGLVQISERKGFFELKAQSQAIYPYAKNLMAKAFSKVEEPPSFNKLPAFQARASFKESVVSLSVRSNDASFAYKGLGVRATGILNGRLVKGLDPNFVAVARVQGNGGENGRAVLQGVQGKLIGAWAVSGVNSQSVRGFAPTLKIPKELKGMRLKAMGALVDKNAQGILLGINPDQGIGGSKAASIFHLAWPQITLSQVSVKHRETLLEGSLKMALPDGKILGQLSCDACALDGLPVNKESLATMAYTPLISPVEIRLGGSMKKPEVFVSGHAEGIWGLDGGLTLNPNQGPAFVRAVDEGVWRVRELPDRTWNPRQGTLGSSSLMMASVAFEGSYENGTIIGNLNPRLEDRSARVNEAFVRLRVNPKGELRGTVSASIETPELVIPLPTGTVTKGRMLADGVLTGTTSDPGLSLDFRDHKGFGLEGRRLAEVRGSLKLDKHQLVLEQMQLKSKNAVGQFKGVLSMEKEGENRMEAVVKNMEAGDLFEMVSLFAPGRLPPGLARTKGLMDGSLMYQGRGTQGTLLGHLESDKLALGERDLGKLRLDLNGPLDRLALSAFTLSGGAFLVQGSGIIGKDQSNLEWQFSQLPMGLVSDILSLSQALGGVASGSLIIAGVNSGDLPARTLVEIQNPSFGNFVADSAYADLLIQGGTVFVSSAQVNRTGGQVLLSGEAPMNATDPMSLSVELVKTDLAQWIKVLPEGLSLSAPTQGKLRVSGRLGTPQVEGVLTVKNPIVASRDQKWQGVEGGEVNLTFSREGKLFGADKSRLVRKEGHMMVNLKGHLERLGARANLLGEMNLTHLVRAEPNQTILSMSMATHQAAIGLKDTLEGRVSMNLNFHGQLDRYGQPGKLLVGGQAAFDKDTVFFLRSPGEVASQTDPLRLVEYRVKVLTDPVAGLRVRGPARTIDLTVVGESTVVSVDGVPAMDGEMAILQGELLLFNNRFVMERGGKVRFVQLSGIWPEVSVKAKARVRGTEIQVALDGPLNQITVDTSENDESISTASDRGNELGDSRTSIARFTSTPPKSQREILSLLLRRELVEGSLASGSFGTALEQQLTDVLGVYTSSLLSAQGRRYGFESLDVSLTENNDLFVLVERRVKEKFLVHYQQKFDVDMAREMSLKWEFRPETFLSGGINEKDESNIFLERRQSIDF